MGCVVDRLKQNVQSRRFFIASVLQAGESKGLYDLFVEKEVRTDWGMTLHCSLCCLSLIYGSLRSCVNIIAWR